MFVTTQNRAPLTAVKASTWTDDPLGQRVWDNAGRKYVFVQLAASCPATSFGHLCGLKTNASVGPADFIAFVSTQLGASNGKFLGIMCNKDAAASGGQKVWVCYEGPLGKIANSKLKSAQTPLTLWCSTHATMASGDFLHYSTGNHYLYSANMSLQKTPVVGMAFSTDTSQKLTKGFIRSNIIS